MTPAMVALLEERAKETEEKWIHPRPKQHNLRWRKEDFYRDSEQPLTYLYLGQIDQGNQGQFLKVGKGKMSRAWASINHGDMRLLVAWGNGQHNGSIPYAVEQDALDAFKNYGAVSMASLGMSLPNNGETEAFRVDTLPQIRDWEEFVTFVQPSVLTDQELPPVVRINADMTARQQKQIAKEG